MKCYGHVSNSCLFESHPCVFFIAVCSSLMPVRVLYVVTGCTALPLGVQYHCVQFVQHCPLMYNINVYNLYSITPRCTISLYNLYSITPRCTISLYNLYNITPRCTMSLCTICTALPLDVQYHCTICTTLPLDAQCHCVQFVQHYPLVYSVTVYNL